MVQGTKLSLMDGPQTEAEKKDMANVPYMNMIRALRYATDCTRLDIAFTTSMLVHYLANPGPKHVEATKQCFRYLAGSKSYWLQLGSQGTVALAGFSDADGSTLEGSKAISRSIFKLG